MGADGGPDAGGVDACGSAAWNGLARGSAAGAGAAFEGAPCAGEACAGEACAGEACAGRCGCVAGWAGLTSAGVKGCLKGGSDDRAGSGDADAGFRNPGGGGAERPFPPGGGLCEFTAASPPSCQSKPSCGPTDDHRLTPERQRPWSQIFHRMPMTIPASGQSPEARTTAPLPRWEVIMAKGWKRPQLSEPLSPDDGI